MVFPSLSVDANNNGVTYTLSDALVDAFDNDLTAIADLINNLNTPVDVNIDFNLSYVLDPELNLNDAGCPYAVKDKSSVFVSMVDKLSDFVVNIQDNPNVNLDIDVQITNDVELA